MFTNGRKRLITILLVLLLSVTLTACGGQPEEGQTPTPTDPATGATTAEPGTEPGTEPGGLDADNTDERTLEGIIQVFVDNGFDAANGFDLFPMEYETSSAIGAIGGVDFGSIHIYEFSSEAALDEAWATHAVIEEQAMLRNGRFLLESPLDEIRELFESIP